MALSSQCLVALLGRAVKVTLKCGVFQGVLQHVNPDRSLLLRTVKNLETGRSSPGIKMFFGPEIVNVELLDDPDSGKGTTELSEYVEEFPSFHKKKEEENVEYTVIDSFQEKFGPAVLHLKQQCVVSIAGEGVNLCRYGKLSWLEIASKSRIFLFDIFLLGPQAFKNGLQMLLEDKNILKVMHDCRWISDCLFHQYGVLLSNVFDTQVADALQFSMVTGGFLPHRVCTLQECLMHHLKIPSKWDAIMKCRQQMASENPDIWFLRPFPPSLLKALALKAMHLLLLHSSLMETLMSDLTAVVHDYLNTYRSGSGDHLCSTKPTCMELPKELRQLLDIQKLRKERAMKNYRMNKDGLLIRPTPMEFKKRNDPREDGNYRDDLDHSPTNKAMSHLTSYHNRDVLCQEKLKKSKSRGRSVEEP
ncbi:PREDICTED: exonuclease 3'-5' domain-containing protein 1 [Nestor notabilis]|uniref:exonuclease 3'-5' domain-containing protein 1 n=1 Tax=Nestor notabilis TaxID=176057 RepID=UPI000523B1B4|nr:PREDICTED: exonuclease 3'-5' domain-containing protein 1 [Nestor notabilis]